MSKFVRFAQIFILILVLLSANLSFFYVPPLNPPIKKINIFLEVYASSPVLWESIEIIKSAPDELNIFAFHRYPKRLKKIDLTKINAIEIPLEEKEGSYNVSPRKFLKEIKEIISKYPDTPLEVYSNQNQTSAFLFPLLADIGVKRIKRLHLYEDGACNIIGQEYHKRSRFKPIDGLIQNILETNFNPTLGNFGIWKFSFSKLLPTTYHWCMADRIKKDENLKEFVQYIGEENIVQIDLKTEKKRLNGREKKLLAQFFGIDRRDYQKSWFQKTLVVTSGFLLGRQKQIKQEINNFKPLQNLNAKIYLKCHPSYSARAECNQIKKVFPNWIPIDESIPLEAFFLLGLEPDYVAGWLSSLYFLIPPEKILYVLKGPYLKRMMDLGIIPAQKLHAPKSF